MCHNVIYENTSLMKILITWAIHRPRKHDVRGGVNWPPTFKCLPRSMGPSYHLCPYQVSSIHSINCVLYYAHFNSMLYTHSLFTHIRYLTSRAISDSEIKSWRSVFSGIGKSAGEHILRNHVLNPLYITTRNHCPPSYHRANLPVVPFLTFTCSARDANNEM